jgi:YaiO family outer membrane protein
LLFDRFLQARLLFVCTIPFSLFLPSPGGAADEEWFFELAAERSDVSLGGRDVSWGTDRAQLSYRRPEKGGAFLAFELQRRDGSTDSVVLAGGHRRLGDWTLFGQLGFTPGADFYFERLLEVEVSRRAVGNLVGHLTYRFLDFPAARVQLLAPAATWYFPWGEIHGRAFLVRNQTLAVGSRAYLLRGLWEVQPRLRLTGGAAFGERIFDVTSLASEPAEGWSAFLSAMFRLDSKNAVGLAVSLAHEAPSFDKRSLGLFYRRAF